MATHELKFRIAADVRGFRRAIGVIKREAIHAAKALAVAGAAAAGYSIREALKFAAGMAQVRAITRMSQADIERLGGKVKAVAGDLGVNLHSAVKGLYDAISAGIPPGNAVDFLRVAAKGAVGGATEIAVAVDGLTSVINAYGLTAGDATRVSDVMFRTVEQGKITYEELSANIGKLAPSAKAAGMSLEEMGGALAAIVKVEKPEEGITSLRAALMSAAAKGRNLLRELERLRGASLEEILKAGYTRQASRGIALLAGNLPELRKQIELAKNSAGIAEAAFRAVAEGPEHGLRVLAEQFRGMAVGIGEKLLPVLLDVGTRLRDWLGEENRIAAIGDAFVLVANGIALAAAAMEKLIKWMEKASPLMGPLADVLAHVYAIQERGIGAPEKSKVLGWFQGATVPGFRRPAGGAALPAEEVEAARRLRGRGLRTEEMGGAYLWEQIRDEVKTMRLETQGEGKTQGFPKGPKGA